MALLPIQNNELISSFLGNFDSTLEMEENGVMTGKLYENNVHYNSTRLLEEDDFEPLGKFQKKKKEATELRLLRYARSLAPLSQPKVIIPITSTKTKEEKISKSTILAHLQKVITAIMPQVQDMYHQVDKALELEVIEKYLETSAVYLRSVYHCIERVRQRKAWEADDVQPILTQLERLQAIVIKLMMKVSKFNRVELFFRE